jgi:hypothetical protein
MEVSAPDKEADGQNEPAAPEKKTTSLALAGHGLCERACPVSELSFQRFRWKRVHSVNSHRYSFVFQIKTK